LRGADSEYRVCHQRVGAMLLPSLADTMAPREEAAPEAVKPPCELPYEPLLDADASFRRDSRSSTGVASDANDRCQNYVVWESVASTRDNFDGDDETAGQTILSTTCEEHDEYVRFNSDESTLPFRLCYRQDDDDDDDVDDDDDDDDPSLVPVSHQPAVMEMDPYDSDLEIDAPLVKEASFYSVVRLSLSHVRFSCASSNEVSDFAPIQPAHTRLNNFLAESDGPASSLQRLGAPCPGVAPGHRRLCPVDATWESTLRSVAPGFTRAVSSMRNMCHRTHSGGREAS